MHGHTNIKTYICYTSVSEPVDCGPLADHEVIPKALAIYTIRQLVLLFQAALGSFYSPCCQYYYCEQETVNSFMFPKLQDLFVVLCF